MTDLSTVLACPRCDSPLHGLHCRACRVDFPDHGGVPWLFADPEAAVSDWQNRWRLAVERMQADLGLVKRALARQPRAATRRRLETLVQGYESQRRCLETLLKPLDLARGGSMETLLALRTRLPASHGILSYDANAHRDWCWGEHENRGALEAVLESLSGAGVERLLVLGAGAGRLAYDLHQNTEAALTVAVDVNPLLAYVGHHVTQGKSVQLMEFPLAPRTAECAAITRTLSAPAPSRPGLNFVLADALRPPFAAGAFDVVVTPWLLDVIGEDAATVARRINPLIKDGGWWISHGSVAFDRPDPAERLTPDELCEVMTESGFDGVVRSETNMPYMDCPDSLHGRRETVMTLHGRKTAPAQAPPKHQGLPDWIAQGRSPVPDLPAFRTQAMTTRVHAFIMSLIDGRRSLKDMARIMEDQGLMPRREAETALRGFLTKMRDEAERFGRP